jgi:hypothetical protein
MVILFWTCCRESCAGTNEDFLARPVERGRERKREEEEGRERERERERETEMKAKKKKMLSK